MGPGLLDPNDPRIQELLQQLAVSEQQKKSAGWNALSQAGFGMMGARKGQEGAAIGRAGLLGGQAYQQGLLNARNENVDKLKLQQYAAQMAAAQAKAREEAALKQRLAGVGGPNLSAMGPGGPTPENAARVTPGPESQWEQYARIYAEANRPEDAKRYADMAQSGRKKVQSQDVRMMNGKPVVVITYQDGTQSTSEYSPTPETQIVDLGGRKQVIDKLTTAPGTSFDMTKTFADITAEGNLKVNQGQLAETRRHHAVTEGQSARTAEQGKWQYDGERGGLVNMQTGEFKPATQAGTPIGAKGESKNRENAGSALAIIDEAEKLIGKSTGSYAGAGIDKVAQVFGTSTDGADAVAQLQALEGALMLRQPRMEGPQSDRDTAIYKQMAGKIGDPTVPQSQKKAALQVIRKLHERYAGKQSAPQGNVIDFSQLPK